MTYGGYAGAITAVVCTVRYIMIKTADKKKAMSAFEEEDID